MREVLLDMDCSIEEPLDTIGGTLGISEYNEEAQTLRFEDAGVFCVALDRELVGR